jgi:hypothetical protein
MKSSAVAKTAGRVIDIERGREKLFAKHVQLFIEDLRQQPRHKIKVDSNAAEIRSLAVSAIRHSKKGSLTFGEIRAAISYALDFEIKWEYFMKAIVSDMKESRLAVMGGRVFVL